MHLDDLKLISIKLNENISTDAEGEAFQVLHGIIQDAKNTDEISKNTLLNLIETWHDLADKETIKGNVAILRCCATDLRRIIFREDK